MTGCSGVTDYRIILNNDYYIAKTSANNAKIFKIEDKDITGRAHQYLYIIKKMMKNMKKNL